MTTFGDITLRPEYQDPAHIATLEALKSKNYRGPITINASVGAGKTILIGAQAKYWTDRNARVLVLARQGELVEQDSEDAWVMQCKNSLFSASLKQKSTTFKCVMGTELTVSNHLNREFSKDRFVPDLLLIDECHHVNFEELESWMRGREKAEEFEVTTSYGKIITHFLTINKNLRIVGYTGSPYRGRTDIINKFWTKPIYEISTMELTSMGYLVPPIFGFPDADHQYDLSEFELEGGQGAHDFSSKELVAMQRKIAKDKTRTQVIIEEVIERTKNRNGVLITCAGKKHCEQVAEFLPPDSYGIVTDSTSTTKRREILLNAKQGKLKFVLQVGCLTTGIDVSYWDTNVLMRRIGSMTLLTQLLGRTARLLKPFLSAQGIIKDDHLILDYAGVFESMGNIYDDPILDKALAKFTEKDGPKRCPECDTVSEPGAVKCENPECDHHFKQICEKCGTVNSQYAVRCINEDEDSKDGRCENFFSSQLCLACNTENAPTAQSCRNCDSILIDPNKNLVNKAYSDDDYKPVIKVEFKKSERDSQLLWVIYHLDSVYYEQGIAKPEFAKECFSPFSSEQHKKAVWQKFIRNHINGYRMQAAVRKNPTVDALIKNKAMFDIPTHITHRVNNKGFSIISRKKFRSGRVEK